MIEISQIDSICLYWTRLSIQLESIIKMKKVRAIIFNIIFQIAVTLLILDFKFNPLQLSSTCLTAKAASEQAGSGMIMDCIACHSFSAREVGDQFIGHIEILVPMRERTVTGLDWRLPFDSTQLKSNKTNEFMYQAQVLTQTGCMDYQCKAFHSLSDFPLKSKQNMLMLNQYNIQHQSEVTFQISNESLAGINLRLGLDFTREKIVMLSSAINRKELSSMIVRTRHSVVAKIEGDRMPAFLVHELQTSIYIRLMLVLVILLESGRLMSLLSHYTTCIKAFLFLLLVSSFLSATTAVIASSIAIYLTISRLMNIRTAGIVTAALFFLISNLTLYYSFSFYYSSFFVIIYSLVISGKELKDHFGMVQLGNLGGIIGSLFFMSMLQWKFYIFLAPLLLLSTVLSIKQEKDSQKTTKYDLINFNDEEEDVLSKIERELR